MKCSIPEISWHNREPVLSVDIHPDFNQFYRLASGGGDSHVLIWQIIIEENGAVKQEVISDLKRHQRSVNVVKWSPSGTYLASGDDDANIIIWHLKADNIPSLDDDPTDQETWNVLKILRGHKEDVYDLCWSPNGLKLISGSIDNTAILWDLLKGKNEQILTDHKGFVQGVAWDPKGQYIATISTDRICRIYDNSGKHVKSRIVKGMLPFAEGHELYKKEVKYFHDDTFKSFFRRLSFSPDGSILIVPSGQIVSEEGKAINCTYIFVVETNYPAAILPLVKQCSTVVKCCPIYFELREDGPEPYINLPYRMLFAVGTDHDVILYDTQQITPFARFNNVHYTRLTDLTWSSDGLLLIASSTDGFCTIITFELEELGTHYIKEESETEESGMNISTPSETVEVIEIAENLPPKEVVSRTPIRVITPKRVKKPPSIDKNATILSFFKKAAEKNKETVKQVLVERPVVKEDDDSTVSQNIDANIEQGQRIEITPSDENSIDVFDNKSTKQELSTNSSLSSKKESDNLKLSVSEKQPKRITPHRVS